MMMFSIKRQNIHWYSPRLLLLVVGTLALGASAWPGRAEAQIVLTESSADFEFAVFGLSNANDAAAPVFVNGMLVYPGSISRLYPTITSEIGPFQFAGGLPIAPTPFRSTANASAIGTGSNFGSGAIELGARVSGSTSLQGATLQGSGLFFSSSSFLTSSAATNVASVGFSRGHATYVNNGPALAARPGVLLNVSTTIGAAAGSFIAVGLTASLTIGPVDGETFSVFDLGSLVMAYQGPGSQQGGLVPSLTNPLQARGAASLLFPTAITLPTGHWMTISGSLTLISDPESVINVETALPSDFTGPIPEFGVSVGGTSVPEPSVWVLSMVGLAVVTLARRRHRPQRA